MWHLAHGGCPACLLLLLLSSRYAHPTRMSHRVTLDPEWAPPPPGLLPGPRWSLTCGHQLHDQLGVGDVGAADLGPAGPQALRGYHTAHVICARGMPSVPRPPLAALPGVGEPRAEDRSLAAPAPSPSATSGCSALGLSFPGWVPRRGPASETPLALDTLSSGLLPIP